jgi:hypothetical protein
MRVLKPLDSDGYTQNNYVAFVSQSYRIISGSSNNTELVTIDLADQPPVDWKYQQDKDIDLGTYNTLSGVYSYPLFSLINRAFYSTQSIVDYYTSSVAATKFTPTQSMYVVNITGGSVGDGIGAGTFSIRVSGSTTPILDDGYGRLYVNDTGSVVGNVFYKHGFAVIQNNLSAPTHSISTGGLHIIPFRFVDVQFSSSYAITEHTIVCKLQPTEFNSTILNSSVGYYQSVTGSYVSGSTTVTYTNYVPNVSSSAKASSGEPLGGLFDSGTLTPYVTSIGLYDKNFQLLAIGKLANPVPRTKNVDQTFIVKFDT